MTGQLAGQVVLVTGAGTRLGRAIALGLASRGASVAVHHHTSVESAAEVVREARGMGVHAESFHADLTQSDAVEALPARVIAALGHLDGLVNNAGIFHRTPFGTITAARWDETLDLDLRAPFLLAQAAAPHLAARGTGRIVNIADVAGLDPWVSYLPYSIAKAGLIAMTRGLARALAPKITVNAIAPGVVLPAAEMAAADVATALRRVPLGRAGTPQDVVDAVLYLLTASYVTGVVLPVDGGRSVG